MKSASISFGIIGLAVVAMCGLLITPVQMAASPDCAISPVGVSSHVTAGTWYQGFLNGLFQSLRGPVQYAEEEAEEEEKPEEWPELPDRIWGAVQLG